MASLILLSLLTLTSTQHVGIEYQGDKHPPLTWQSCTTANGCTTHNGNLTLDANWRWIHNLTSSVNCYTDGEWNTRLCPDGASCTKNCGLDGTDYRTLGINTTGDAVSMKYLNRADFVSFIGSRLFLLKDESHYETFNLLNREISFDVDVSKLPCGIQGALYFVGMDADGGTSRYPNNTAGAKYGTGYCDASCPRYNKFINGKANVEGWTSKVSELDGYYSDSSYANDGYGAHGSCCTEIDVFNSNSISTSMSAKPCSDAFQTQCVGDTCGSADFQLHDFGTCDYNGCDFNPYRLGNTSFYGPGKTVDSTKKFSVTTQFITDDGTAQGTLVEIKRFYTQNGIKIPNAQPNAAGVSGNSITSNFCDDEKSAFGDPYGFKVHGGWKSLTNAMRNGLVLTMMVWRDIDSDMLWLDSTFPVNSTGPGTARGTCGNDNASIDSIDNVSYAASVGFSKIRIGDIGTTA